MQINPTDQNTNLTNSHVLFKEFHTKIQRKYNRLGNINVKFWTPHQINIIFDTPTKLSKGLQLFIDIISQSNSCIHTIIQTKNRYDSILNRLW